jgi:hypothetical protein
MGHIGPHEYVTLSAILGGVRSGSGDDGKAGPGQPKIVFARKN